jgi:dTDP-4-dehydrorhamnose 3,5-epimerase
MFHDRHIQPFAGNTFKDDLMSFTFTKLALPEVVLIEPDSLEDSRGSFAELFKQSEFTQNGINSLFTQVNHSKSGKNVVRGLHYQINPKAQGKLIQVIAGEIFDVAVDIRKNSPRYGTWCGKKLSANNIQLLSIPEGFAHGFSVLSGTAAIIYYCTQEYAPEHEKGIIWNDKHLKIDWQVEEPVLSPKDAQLPSLKEAINNFVYHENRQYIEHNSQDL